MFQTLRDLLAPPAGMRVDFSHPSGAPALVDANGISWKIFANPVALFIGGVAAVLLELAEPSVRAGVWEHTQFRTDPATRLKRTGFAAMVTVYAPREEAQRMIARVVRMHDHVEGTTAEGLTYRANDPRLLNWVQATAVFGFTQAYHAYVTALTAAERSDAFAEGQEAARLYGATHAPCNWQEWEHTLRRTAPMLADSPVLCEFLDIMATAPILPGWMRPLQRLLVRAAVEMTPEPVRSMPSLQGRGLRSGERWVVKLIGCMAQFMPWPQLPAAQARQRMRSR